MDGTGSRVKAQCDRRAFELWNELAEGVKDVLAELTLILREDFPSFCALLLRVRPKGGGYTVPLVFNQVQARMWREMCKRIAAGEEPWFVCLKFRQAGMSTFWCAWLFWQIWRQNDIQTMIIAHQTSTGETMVETMRVFFDELPDIFKPDLRDGNHGATIPRGEVYFADRRSWTMIHLSKNVDPRGQQVTHVLETEYASFHDPDELNGALLPQLPTFGSEGRLRSSVVIESTPKGQNEFYDLYNDAKKGILKSFKALFYPWFLFDEQYSAKCPSHFKLTKDEQVEMKRLSSMRMHDYAVEDGGGKPVTREQMYWRRETIASDYRGNADRFNQEYPSDDETCFLLASKSVFRPNILELDRNVQQAKEYARQAWSKVMVDGKPVVGGIQRVVLQPEIKESGKWTPITHVGFKLHPHGAWSVWEPPQQGHKYIVGADPAMGLEESDNSAICVIDVTEARQVAEFAETMGPERFAIEIAAVGYWYNTALLVPEINNIGYVVLNHLIAHITYPNLYRWPKFDEVNRYTHKRGWETNTRTKQLMVSSMINYVEEGLISISSRDLLSEMSTFERKNEEDYIAFAAQKGRQDDRVMAFGLALMGIDQTPILSGELLKANSRLPSASDLHLAQPQAERITPPMPKQIEEMINVKHTIPWTCFGSDIPL